MKNILLNALAMLAGMATAVAILYVIFFVIPY
jgi:hypothetical protein